MVSNRASFLTYTDVVFLILLAIYTYYYPSIRLSSSSSSSAAAAASWYGIDVWGNYGTIPWVWSNQSQSKYLYYGTTSIYCPCASMHGRVAWACQGQSIVTGLTNPVATGHEYLLFSSSSRDEERASQQHRSMWLLLFEKKKKCTSY